MKVLVTGHDGYIGTILVPMLQQRGHEVVGMDSMLFEPCVFGTKQSRPDVELRVDVRDAAPEHFAGVGAVIHLAGMSNDPAGDLNPEATYEINHRASTRLAEIAKDAGVQRFLFSSSCSTYGAHGDDFLTESAEFLPVTPYGESKVFVEQDLAKLADDLGNVADAVVLLGVADVERLVVHGVTVGFHQHTERPRDVLDVHQRAP